MAIGLSSAKILWGRAGGKCSNPECRADLTKSLEDEQTIHIGEMAHVIAHSGDGPRGNGSGGSDDYENLVLLCPNCHTTVDKAPDSFPADRMRDWKAGREAEVEAAGKDIIFANVRELKVQVATILWENYELFKSLGPKSEIAESDPGSDAFSFWEARKLDTLLPNNRRIINIIEQNRALLDLEDLKSFAKFKVHALAYEKQQYGRTEYYPTFPEEFEKRFSE
jgi:hypothetical protein